MLSILKRITTWTLSSFGWSSRTREHGLNQISDVTRVIMDWPEDESFSADEAMRRHPHLQDSRESMISFAVHEYRELRSCGRIVDVDQFLLKFPESLRSELNDAITVDRGLTVLSGLVAGLKTTDNGSRLQLYRNIDWPGTGEVFAGFRLEEPLGRGGFSRVFVAREIGFENRQVALKICRIDTHEPSVLANLQHAGIGTIHSVTEVPERGLIAISMPLLSRTTLLDVRTHVWSRMRCPSTAARVWECVERGNRLNRTPPFWAESSFCDWVIDLTISLARSLSVSHEKGIVHCDIKPSNVLLGENGQPILFDFNIAFHRLASEDPARVGGTVPYMAPEHIEAFFGGDASSVGPQSDLFSLGATIYELLTGVAPYGHAPSSRSGIEQLLALRQSPPTEIQHLNPVVPVELAELVHACLSSAVEDRPSSAADIANRLEEIKKQSSRRRASYRRLVAGLAGSAAAIAVSAAVFVSRTPDSFLGRSAPSNASGAERGFLDFLDPESEPPQLTAGQITQLMDQGYALLDQDAAVEAFDNFVKVLQSDNTHFGASIGAMRAAFRLPEPPINTVVSQVAHNFDPRSIPELDALCGTALGGGLFNHHGQAEFHLNRAINAGKNDDATMNNYAFSLDSQGKHEKSREILEDMLNDGDAPDTARLLMARHRMQAFLAKTTRLTLSQPIDECIDELKSDDLLGACQRSAFRSLMLAKLEHTCCTAYASEARRSQQQLSEEENRKWLTHSRAAIRAYEDAVEQGMAPYMWNLITASLHPEIKDTRTYRERYTQFVENGPKHKVIHYRRRFLQDPVVGTRFERWKEATLEEGAALTDTSSNQAASEPTRAVATAR